MQKPEVCRLLMSKVLYLLVVEGETLTTNEVLFIKEVAEKTSAEEVIIVVSTLLKDLNSENELFRANSLRVLSRILDVGIWS